MSPLALRLIAIGALLITGAWGGWLVASGIYVGQIARLKIERQQTLAAAEQQFANQLRAAVARGDALAARVASAETALQTQLEENHHAIRRLTTGRPCLGSAAVRLLNSAPVNATAVPATASQLAEPDAAFASDTDVGLWAASARRQYDVCRGRLSAVADFYEATHPHPGPPLVRVDTAPAGHKGEGVK